MSHARCLLLGLAVVLGTAALAAAGEDSREQYGTKSLETAQQITRAIDLKNDGKLPLGTAGAHMYPSSLFKSLAVPNGLLPAEVRHNAASNAYRVLVSGDGHWVAVPGGGGWRPNADGGKGSGYGIAVFSAHNLDHVQGFFRTDAYPKGGAFNPVTGQFAAVRQKEASLYHLTGPNGPSVLKGDFNGVCTWSGRGDYLVLANGGKGGITVYANPLTPAEEEIAATWWKHVETPKPPEAPRPTAPTIQPVGWLAAFAVKASRADAQEALARALEEGQTERRPGWRAYPPYASNAQAAALIAEVVPQLNKADDGGIAIYRLRNALKSDPDFVPLKYHLASALKQTGQAAQARALYEAVVRDDVGRTELSCLALNALGELLTQEGKPLAAIYCLALSARLDKANPHTIELLVPLLQQSQFDTEAAKLSKHQAALPTPAAVLPKLPLPAGPDVKLTASEIFEKAVDSVVLIQAGGRTGTGMCIGKPGIILTNYHIVEGSAPVYVQPFQLKEGKAQPMATVQARLLHSDAKHDIAVLKLTSVPATMRALIVAASGPKTGEAVCAIGNPGLGPKILEQSISEGIVSSSSRLLAGVAYIQHTAAVNPGNSGGPLLNDRCQVIGMNTLKTSLQGGYFAIPASTIRSVFPPG